MEDNINNKNQLWGRKGTSCTVKSRPSPASILTTKTEEKKGKDAFLLALFGLSSYPCRVCPMCVSLSRLGSGIHPTTVGKSIAGPALQLY